jgi:ABC-type amino acid transport system permease subunit
MIIWTGSGYLVGVFIFGCSLGANLIANGLTGSSAYWNNHRWTFAVAMIPAAALCFVVGRWLYGRKTRKLTDTETGEPVVIRPSHTMFFVPMPYWSIICLALGALALFGAL